MVLVTTRKRNLGQGNIFTGICLPAAGSLQSRGFSVQESICPGGLYPGVSVQGVSIHGSLSKGVSVQGVSVQWWTMFRGVSVQGVSV